MNVKDAAQILGVSPGKVYALAAPAENEWRTAIDNELVCAHIGTWESFPDAKSALNAVINWQVQVALDPQVSEEAQALIDRGRAAQPVEPMAWIKVSDRLPTERKEYVHDLLVRNEHGNVDICSYDGYAKYFDTGRSNRLGGWSVIEWMPLPPTKPVFCSPKGAKLLESLRKLLFIGRTRYAAYLQSARFLPDRRLSKVNTNASSIVGASVGASLAHGIVPQPADVRIPTSAKQVPIEPTP